MKSIISTIVAVSVMDVQYSVEIEVIKLGPDKYNYTDRITQYTLEGTLDDILQEVRRQRQDRLNEILDNIKELVGNVLPSTIGSCLPLSTNTGRPRMLVTCVLDGNAPVYSVQLYGLPLWLSAPFLATRPEGIRKHLDNLKRHTDYAPDVEAAFKEFQSSWA